MQQALKSLISSHNKIEIVNLFGYTTKGLPGLEIIGLPKNGRMLKEKLIYLIRKEQLVIPQRRYVLCLERCQDFHREDDLRWLEMPFMVLYLTLSGILPLQQLENCFSAGLLSLEGKCVDYPYSNNFFLENPGLQRKCFLTAEKRNPEEEFMSLNLRELLQGKIIK